MNKLIEVSEELYKQIDKAQVHLINARLKNDDGCKKSAIYEMETAMCNAMQLLKCFIDRNDKEQKADSVNHPAHYNSHPSGIECIEIARHHNFNIGNTIKYLWRATNLMSRLPLEFKPVLTANMGWKQDTKQTPHLYLYNKIYFLYVNIVIIIYTNIYV